MSEFAESLESEWKATGLSTSKFSRATQYGIVRGKGQLLRYKLDTNGFMDEQITELVQILYVDDGAFIFNSREDLIKCISIINAQLKKFGMAMYIGKSDKAFQTE